MARSRKHRNRLKARAQRRQKELRALQPRYVYQPPHFFSKLFSDHKHEWALALTVLLFIAALFFFKKDRSFESSYALMESHFKASASAYAQKYPKGYTIMAATKQGVKKTSFNSLPTEIAWRPNTVEIKFIDANPITGDPPQLRIRVPSGTVPHPGEIAPSASVVLPRGKGASRSLGTIGRYRLSVELIEDRGETVFVLFGAR